MKNVFADDWDDPHPRPPGWERRTKRLVPRGRPLGATVYEIDPGETQTAYHFHHGNDELLLVLAGRPTLRTPAGERELEPGDAVHFPTGPDGAHQLWNRGDVPARVLLVSNNAATEAIEYPDSRKVLVRSDVGELITMHRLADAVDYFDEEEPRA